MGFTRVLGPGITSSPVIAGVITSYNFVTGTSNVHNIGMEVAQLNVLGGNTKIGSGSTIYFDGGARYTGIVSASAFHGSGAALTGIDATALKDSGGSIKVQANNSGAIVSGALTVTGVLSYEDVARVDATGLSTFREGFTIGPHAGIALTAYSDGSIRSSGVITATTFYGSGANLTGIDATALKDGSGNVKIQANQSGAVITGVTTVNNGIGTVHLGYGTTALLVEGDTRITGILTIGTGSITLNSETETIDFSGTCLKRHSSGDLEVVDDAGNSKALRAKELYIGANKVLDNSRNVLSGVSIDGGRINSGTVNTARLGSGTANSSTFLRGDNSWASIDLSKCFRSHDGTSGGWEDSNRNFKIKSGGNAVGLAMHESDDTFGFQIYGDGSDYGFLTSNWGNWDIRKTPDGQAYLRISGTQREIWHAANANYNNLSNLPAAGSTTLYIDVYNTGNTTSRDTARNWATSAVSVPNNCIFAVRWYYYHQWWGGNGTNTSSGDYRTLWWKNSSGSMYYMAGN